MRSNFQAAEVRIIEDMELVELYWQRSERAIPETAAKYGKYCHAIADNILGNKEDAEECINDTYLDVWNSIPPHRPELFSAFIGKIARRIAIDRVRRRNAEKRGGGELPLILEELTECLPAVQTTEEVIQEKEFCRLINVFLTTLSDTERRVFLCRYWYADSISAVAEQFSFSQSKVKSMLHRIRERLKQYLIEEGYL